MNNAERKWIFESSALIAFNAMQEIGVCIAKQPCNYATLYEAFEWIIKNRGTATPSSAYPYRGRVKECEVPPGPLETGSRISISTTGSSA